MNTKTQMTKVFVNGDDQMVLIPDEYRFEEDEIYVSKVGDALLLTPRSALVRAFREGIESIPGDFMKDGRPDEIAVNREGLD